MVTPTLYGPSSQIISTNGRGRPAQPTRTLLGTGLSFWKGVISEEYLADLKPWSKAVKILKEMEDDAVIGTLYESVRAPLLDARFWIEPASDSDIDIEAAKFLAQNTYQSPIFDWLAHVDEMLDFMSFGFSLAEKVLEKRPDGRLWLSDLMPIGQETLHRWGEFTNKGYPKSFTQHVITDDLRNMERTAPMSKLLHFTFRGRKRNPMGRPLSRHIYRAWLFRKNLEVVEAIGAERDVGNVPVAQLGEGIYTDEEIQSIKDALEGLRIDETSYLLVPNGTEVKAFGSGGKVYDIRTIIRDYDHKIRQTFFMDFVALGAEQVGTQALAKEVTGFFSLALGAIQQQSTSVWNRQLVPWLFEWNKSSFGEITNYPILRWSKPGKINLQSVAQSIVTMIASGVIHTNYELEVHIRELFELPPLSEQEYDDLEKLKQDMAILQNASVGSQPTSTKEKTKGAPPGGDTKTKMS